jgi:polysaccharide deacetylase 2 family uncharacterized protein YibQ
MQIEPLPRTAGPSIRGVRFLFENIPVFQFQLHEIPRLMRVAIIVDDLGQNIAAVGELTRMRLPIAFSIMPQLRYSRKTADAAHRSGEEVMLHVPMQPIQDGAPDISPNELRVGMRTSQVSQIIQSELDSVPFVVGVNNHMGSRATADIRLMDDVMRVLAPRHLYFIDSVTTGDSVALTAARQFGVSSFYRSVFLDDRRNVHYTLGQLRILCRLVKKKGSALAIGHPYPTTIQALREFLPKFASQGIQLVPPSSLVR